MTTILDRRTRVHEATRDEIKEIARHQIAAQGAAALSLGAIARAMGMTTPALYRYFDSRATLVQELIVEAFHSLADAAEASVAHLPPTAYATRFRTLLLAYRQWAVRSPENYGLVHGTPLDEADERHAAVHGAAMRSLRVIGLLLTEAHQTLRLDLPQEYREPPPPLGRKLAAVQALFPDVPMPPAILTLTILTWMKIHALVWQELHGHVASHLLRGGELYAMEVDVMCHQLGLRDE